MSIEERRFPSLELAARALATDLAATLRDAIALRGRALLAVSGGRTPALVFDGLRQFDLKWECVTVTLTDERWVPPSHAESNERLVRSHLLRGRASNAEFVPLYNGAVSPEVGQASCESRLGALGLPLDAVYLGMGADGHIASLFPGEPAVDADDRVSVAIPGKENRLPRMSLTPSTLLTAKRLFLLFSGADKAAVYEESRQPGTHREIPLRLLTSNAKLPLSVLSAP